MKDKGKLTNSVKNCLIAVLFVSAMLLFYKAVFYESSSDLSRISSMFTGKTSVSTAVSTGVSNSVLSAEPVFILITAKDGAHSSIKYDGQSKSDMFSKFSAALEGALGSSGEPTLISTSDWQKALSSNGVFFDYLYPQPLAFIANCLGTKISGGASSITARRLFLGDNNGNLMLYYIDAGNGLIYSCTTALSFTTVSSKIAEFPLGTAKFAFEAGPEYSNLDPYFIFSYESVKLRGINTVNPLSSDFSATDLMSLFGINSHSVYKYSEDDGSDVYVEGGKTLRIEPSGKVLFNVTGNDGVPVSGSVEALSIVDCISVCSEIAEKSIGLTSGDSNLGLVKISNASSPSTSEIFFGYFVDGIPVSTSGSSYAADFQLSGGSITSAELYYRKCTFSGSTIKTLPEKQATAIAKNSGGEPLLIYEDSSDGVSSSWIIN